MRRYTNLEGCKKVLHLDLDGKKGIRSKNKDRVTLITGYEGSGKSTFALHLFEAWYNILDQKISIDLINLFSDNQKGFVTALNTAQKYQMVVHDEAGKDLYSRNAMSSFSKDLNVAYQVIRGSNLHTVLILPHILDLDSFFRKRRVTQLFHVYEEGKIAYFTKKRLRQMMPKLIKMAQKNEEPDPLLAGNPLFFDTFGQYFGIFEQKYLENKQKNIQEIKDYLCEKYVNDEHNTNTNNYNKYSESPINTENNQEIKIKMTLAHLQKQLKILSKKS